MKIRIEILNDMDQTIWGDERAVEFPFEWKLPPDRPIRGKKYNFYGFTFQPIVKVNLTGEG